MTVSASPRRVDSILVIFEDFLSRRLVPFSKFERLVGKLSFVAQIISGGRTFFRHLFDAYPSSRHSCMKISPAMQTDFSWWFLFLPIWNGSLKIQSDSDCRRFAFMFDASDIACGGATTDRALVHLWSPCQHSWHINVKELWSVYWCLHSWSPEFSGATVMIGCDNLTVVAWPNNGCACLHEISPENLLATC
jgi:hypothetical protein